MGSIEFNTPMLLGAALFIGGALLVVVAWSWKQWPALKQRLAGAVSSSAAPTRAGDWKVAPVRNSDEEAPAGFTEHVGIIRQASNGCPAEVQVEYLAEGLTEAETLRREVARLGGQSTLNGAPQPGAREAVQ